MIHWYRSLSPRRKLLVRAAGTLLACMAVVNIMKMTHLNIAVIAAVVTGTAVTAARTIPPPEKG